MISKNVLATIGVVAILLASCLSAMAVFTDDADGSAVFQTTLGNGSSSDTPASSVSGSFAADDFNGNTTLYVTSGATIDITISEVSDPATVILSPRFHGFENQALRGSNDTVTASNPVTLGGITASIVSVAGVPDELHLTGTVDNMNYAKLDFDVGYPDTTETWSASLAFQEMPTTVSSAYVGQPVSIDLASILGDENIETYNYSLEAGNGSLPAGLTLSSEGLISGVPTAAGSYATIISFEMSEQSGGQASDTYPVIINVYSGTVIKESSVYIQPGAAFTWTPTFPSDLDPVLSVSASDSVMPGESASYGSQSGYASVSNGKLTVSIPANYSGSVYYVVLKAATTQPSQTALYKITFNVSEMTLGYGGPHNAKVGDAFSISPVLNVPQGVTATSYSISGTLPDGLSFNTSTGVISGTPTVASAMTEYTVIAYLGTTPSQTVTGAVSISTYDQLIANDVTFYMTSSGAYDALTLTSNLNGAVWSITDYGGLEGNIVLASDGTLSAIAGATVGQYTVTATAVDPNYSGNSVTVTITVIVHSQLDYQNAPTAGLISF